LIRREKQQLFTRILHAIIRIVYPNLDFQFSDFGGGDIECRRKSNAGMQCITVYICIYEIQIQIQMLKKKVMIVMINRNYEIWRENDLN